MAQEKTVTEKEIQKQEEKVNKLIEQLEEEKKKLAEMKAEFDKKTKVTKMTQLEKAMFGNDNKEKIDMDEVLAFINGRIAEKKKSAKLGTEPNADETGEN